MERALCIHYEILFKIVYLSASFVETETSRRDAEEGGGASRIPSVISGSQLSRAEIPSKRLLLFSRVVLHASDQRQHEKEIKTAASSENPSWKGGGSPHSKQAASSFREHRRGMGGACIRCPTWCEENDLEEEEEDPPCRSP